MEFTLSELWAHMGLFARLIVGVMGIMSLASLFVASERLLSFRKAQRASRAEAIRLAEFYPAGLEIGSFVTVNAPFAKDAYRFENGRLMAGKGCVFRPPSCEDIKGQEVTKHPGLTYRVIAVDEELGITLLRMNFGPAAGRYGEGHGLMVWEAFKVYGGEIHGVEAFMKVMPVAEPSGWDTDVRRPKH